jgi:hypothetical protein
MPRQTAAKLQSLTREEATGAQRAQYDCFDPNSEPTVRSGMTMSRNNEYWSM